MPHSATWMFQSLSGFQVRCNGRALPLVSPGLVFVSIPIGFSSALQLSQEYEAILESEGFNPYRVFKCAATRSAPYQIEPDPKFQSLSGFQVRCNFE